jgi:thiol peroxidase
MEDNMAVTLFKGSTLNTVGEIPAAGSKAPDFVMTKKDMSDISLSSLKGKKVILNIFPSIDTSVCATSVRKFNVEAANLEDTVVVCISADLPFAHARFCGAEGISNVESVSTFRSDFGTKYGVALAESPMKGLMARSVIVLDRDSVIKYSELVADIGHEPDYEKAIAAAKSAG